MGRYALLSVGGALAAVTLCTYVGLRTIYRRLEALERDAGDVRQDVRHLRQNPPPLERPPQAWLDQLDDAYARRRP